MQGFQYPYLKVLVLFLITTHAYSEQTVVSTVEKEDAKSLYESLVAEVKVGKKGSYTSETKRVGPLKCYRLTKPDHGEVHYRCAFKGELLP